MIALAQEAQPLYPEPELVEQQLYSGGFIGRQDDALRARMLRMTPSDFVRHIPALFDERLREHAWRRAFVEAPGELPPDEHQRLQDWRISRRHCADDVPWRTLAAARHEVARIRQQHSLTWPLPELPIRRWQSGSRASQISTVGSEHRSPPTPRRCEGRARRSRRSAPSILGRSSSRAVLPPNTAATPANSTINH